MAEASDDRLIFATVAKAHGIRGAVTLAVSAHHVGVVAPGLEVWLDTNAGSRRFEVRSVAGVADRPIVHFVGVDTRNEAELLRGAAASASRDVLSSLDDDEFFFADLEGCAVWCNDRQVGEVSRVRAMPTQELLEVRIDGHTMDLLVPFTREAVPDVDLQARRIDIAPALLEGVQGDDV